MREILEIKALKESLSAFENGVPVLEYRTEKGIEREEGDEIVAALKETLAANESILALAAPQIGYNSRIFAIKFDNGIKVFIDPIVKKKDKYVIAPETFASMPGKEILVGRPEEIVVAYTTDEYKYEDNKLLGAAARLFDQMIQLLDCMTPDEIGLVSDVKRDGSLSKLKEEEMDQLVEIYKQFIATKSKAYAEAVSNNEELKDDFKKAKFTEDVINGRTLVVAENPKMPKVNRKARRDLKYGRVKPVKSDKVQVMKELNDAAGRED